MIAWVLEDLIAPLVDNLFWVGIKFLLWLWCQQNN